jgi:enediyne biosynthesis protein E3
MVVTTWGALRQRVLTPSMSATLMSVRGFTVKNAQSQELLETVGRMFLTGYGYAAGAGEPAEAQARLEQLPERFRGFAYEGAAMGYAIRDGLPLGGSRQVTAFLDGHAQQHAYMVNVGIGWAMARLPRFRWSSITGTDRLLRWLVLDGYGFHQAYFKTARYVHEQYQEPNFRWPAGGPGWYADRAIDQGIGRAMWFVGGTDPDLVATMIGGFAQSRRADLYAGAGLAATYAGGVDEYELLSFWDRAGIYRPQLAQGAAFGATTRVESGLVTEHTRLAAKLLCGMSPEAATEVCRETRPEVPADDDDFPAYEVWRQRIAQQFQSSGWCDR